MIEALKQALEALEEFCAHGVMIKPIERRDALRQAIREHAMYEVQRLGQEIEQEPVAKVVLTETLELPCLQWLDLNRQFDFKGGEYLYTHPPQRTWVGLTDEEIDKTHETQVWDARRSYARAIEAKLKELNT